jgi:hypothetical protein
MPKKFACVLFMPLHIAVPPAELSRQSMLFPPARLETLRMFAVKTLPFVDFGLL